MNASYSQRLTLHAIAFSLFGFLMGMYVAVVTFLTFLLTYEVLVTFLMILVSLVVIAEICTVFLIIRLKEQEPDKSLAIRMSCDRYADKTIQEGFDRIAEIVDEIEAKSNK